ncbi:MAG TPA: hypothetical protein DDY04_00605 [Bacteroidales bacterium]|nr:hypothetical protein [Bacteroidales bacterium]
MSSNSNHGPNLEYPFNIKHFLSNVKRYYKAGFWYWDSETNHIHFGRKFLADLGFKSPMDGIALDNFLDIIHKDDRKALVKLLIRLGNNSDLHQEMDLRVKMKNEWYSKRITAFVVKKQPTSKKYYIVGQIHDIDSNDSDIDANGYALVFDQFASLLNKHQLALLEMDLNGMVLNWNKNASKLFQLQASGNQPISLKDGFLGDDWAKFKDWLQSTSAKPFTAAYTLLNGAVCHLSWSKLDEQQGRRHCIVAARDVSQLVEIQGQNKMYEFQNDVLDNFFIQIKGSHHTSEIFFLAGLTLEKIFSKSISILFSYCADDSFITLESFFGVKAKIWNAFIDELGWNPVGRRVYTEKDRLTALFPHHVVENTTPFNELLGEIISITSYKLFERIFKISKSYNVGIVKDNTLFGGVIIVQTQESNPVDTQFLTRFSNVMAMTIDFSNANMALSQKVDELKKQLSEKYELISYINHSIRTPLNSIIGFSSMLSYTELDKNQQTKYLDIIQNQSKELLDLTNELQDYIRISTGSLTIINTKQKVNEFMNELKVAISARLDLLEYNNLTVNYSIPENTDFLEFFVDPGRLLQALTIYCNHFIKFIQTGSISIGYVIENEKIKIYIHENESSIDAKVRGMVAEELNSLLSNTSTQSPHFNLLLANRLFNLLGADAKIVNDGKLRFEVELSLMAADEVKAIDEPNDEQAVKKIDFKNKVILVVEDEEVNFLILNELLTAWGASTIWARNGKEAVDLVNSLNQGIHLILMDIRMPVMDGYAATMEIKQINPSIPVIAQTAFSAPQERLKAQAAGCDGYITKPIDQNILHHVLEMYLA